MLVIVLVLSQLDYGNGVLVGIPDYLLRQLQSVLNAAARLIMAALCSSSRCGHYMFILWFLLSSSFFFFFFIFFFFSSPNLSGRRFDVYHTSTHNVALVQIYNAGLKRVARGSLKIQDAKNRQKVAIWAPFYNFVGLHFSSEAL